MAIDPDDPRPAYQQVFNALRAAILTKKIAPGERLPSHNDLVEHYGVARATIQKALDKLKDEGLITTRHGSGSYAREKVARPVSLRPHIEAAFSAPDVTIDFAGYTAETLHGCVREPIDLIRAGRIRPRSLALRLLLVDTEADLQVPASVDGAHNIEVRARLSRIILRYAGSLIDEVNELSDFGLIDQAHIDIRVQSASPAVKLYIINRTEMFLGFYPVVQRDIRLGGEKVRAYDVLGKDIPLFHQESIDPESSEGQHIAAAQTWFDSVWKNTSRPIQL